MAVADFAVGAIEAALRARVAGMGLTPDTADIFRSDAFVALFRQFLERSGGVGFRSLANSNAIANTAAETAFGPAGSVFSLPAGALNSAGRVVRFKACGFLQSTGTPNIIFRARLGGLLGVQVGATFALVTVLNSTAAAWFFSGGFVVRTPGALATIRPENADGALANATAGAAAQLASIGNDGVADVVRDLTIANDLAITAQWSAAAAGNSVTMSNYVVEVQG